jgi:hypothetical protein
VPQVVRPSGQRRGHLFRRERQVPGLVPDTLVRSGDDHSPTFVGEQPPVLAVPTSGSPGKPQVGCRT